MGLLTFENKVKATSRETVRDLKANGIRVCMITGDNPYTASAVALKLGIIPAGSNVVLLDKAQGEGSYHGSALVFTGTDLARVSDAALGQVRVWARQSPQSKSRIIERLQQQGLSCMMVGDGANDSVAMKTADVGLSLAESEISVAGHFISKCKEPRSVLSLMRECRAGLSVGFIILKVTLYYSLAQVIWICNNRTRYRSL
jgi:magnesium-transporting ATPase (P-type)